MKLLLKYQNVIMNFVDYNVGDNVNRSRIFDFAAMDPRRPLRAAVFGDFSLDGGESMNALINITRKKDIDMVFHIGKLNKINEFIGICR